jgi:hypothetical protein
MAKPRLYYYELPADTLEVIKRTKEQFVILENTFLDSFFKAASIKTIRENCKIIEGKCAKATSLEKFEVGKKYKFKVGDPFTFIGTVTGKVKFSGEDHLEIEIIPNDLYFYSYIDPVQECRWLEILEEISE